MAKPLDPEQKAINEATRKVDASKVRIAKLKDSIADETAILNAAKNDLAAAKTAAKAKK